MCVFLVILLCSAIAALPQSKDVENVSTVSQELKNGINSFMDKLTHTLYKGASPHSNVIVSPINIYSGLSLLLLGADGNTREEIATALNFPNTDKTFQLAHKHFGELLRLLELTKYDVCETIKKDFNCTIEDVSIANGVFLQKEYTLLPSYADGLKSYYSGAVENVDFNNNPKEATNQINKWVGKKTHEMIPEFLKKPLDPTVRIMLATTVYFSATWETGIFIPTRTKPDKFFTEADGEVQVEYIHHDKKVLYYDNQQSPYRAISLPYRGADYATVFVLPKANTSINELAEKFSSEDFQKILKEVNFQNVRYKVPCIDIEWTGDLVGPLRSLNVTSTFESANLSKLVSAGTGLLKVSKVMHATKMRMDEKGTVASASTGIEISLRSGRTGPFFKFFVNKPYLLYIYHKESSVILFSALIRNPSVRKVE